ncbi:MAG: outer membrane protein assembly factor BamC [Pseudomonadota bacterium]|nr:outer membrane protein assembly factor BamC [Pseudomonadota bacterium]
MHIVRAALLFTVLIALSGCSYLFGEEGQFRERTMDYQQAESLPSLSIPEGMESRPRQQRYPIPEVGAGPFYQPEDSESIPRPQSLLNVNEAAGLELRQDSGRMWLVVERSTDELWHQLNEFAASNVSIDFADRSQGVIETGWLAPRKLPGDSGFWKSVWRFITFSSGEHRDRFRITMQAVDQNGLETSVVHINHVRYDTPVPETVAWPEEPENDQLVTVVYDELMLYLEQGGRKVGASVLSQDLRALPKYTMTRDGNGYPILVINLDFNRAWLSVGQALERSRIGISDLDRTLGIYYLAETAVVEVDDEEEEKELQLRLISSESGIQVSVQVDDDTLGPEQQSTRILNRVRENLQ